MSDSKTFARLPLRALPLRALPGLMVLTALFLPVALPAQKGVDPHPTTPQPTDRPFLWRIEKSPPSYLYGTIHVPDERVTTLPRAVTDALEASDVVMTEVRFDRVGNVAKRMLLGGKRSLQDVLPEATYARLSGYLEAKGFPIQAFTRVKVWAVTARPLTRKVTSNIGLPREGIHERLRQNRNHADLVADGVLHRGGDRRRRPSMGSSPSPLAPPGPWA